MKTQITFHLAAAELTGQCCIILISNRSVHVVICLVMSCFAIRILMHVRSGLNVLYYTCAKSSADKHSSSISTER